MPSLTGSKGSVLDILIYNLVQQVVGAALSPFLVNVQQNLFSAHPDVAFSPADSAAAVIRGIIDQGRAAGEAQQSGMNSERFDWLVKLAGDAPAPEALAEALRRGLIDDGRYLTGIRQGRLRDEWADLPKALAVREPSPEQILNAYLEGQVDEGYARTTFAKLGGDPVYFDVLFNAQGQAPTPTQALELANRGIIPWGGRGAGVVSYEQAFLEGPWRNKWLAAFQKLGQYIPPPRTITAMYKEGALTHDQAAGYLVDHGLPADLAAAYLSGAKKDKVAAAKVASESTVTAGYEDGVIGRPDAATHLQALGYSAAEAEFVLAVADARVEQAFVKAAIGRVNSAYVAGKIDRVTAAGDLSAFQLPPERATMLLDLWDHEKASTVRTLTPAQITAAFKYEIFTRDQAETQLRALGYTAGDATILVEIAHKGAFPAAP